jgi:hypothetical protein
MRKRLIFFLLVLSSLWGCPSLPERKAPAPKAAAPQTTPAVLDVHTNIHFTGKYCSECHERTPVKGGDPYLKYNGDYQKLCGRCHHGMSPGYCHPLDINAKLENGMTIPADFPLKNGKFTCETCHDMYRQCVKRRFDRYTLRGAPYPRKTDFCYRCHNKKAYPRLDAHRQILSDGKLNTRMCLYCHRKKPDEKTATYKDVTFIGDMSALCRRCHSIEGNHPGNFDHMAKPPPAKALKHMAAMKSRYGIILPLAKDGKMTCITCHNPHEKGVIAANKPSAKGAGSKYRERLPGILCVKCHQM